MWVSIVGSFSTTANIVIFYHPDYSSKQVWEHYSHYEKNCKIIDPDEPKLERVWDLKVNVDRIYMGTIYYDTDIIPILQGRTVYGDFNNSVL